MKAPISAKSSIAGKRLLISRVDRPCSAALSRAFSRPVNSGWNPAPSSSRAATRPETSTVPAVGSKMPAASCKEVLLPDPLAPIRHTVSPWPASNETSRKAQKSALPRPRPDHASSRSRSTGLA